MTLSKAWEEGRYHQGGEGRLPDRGPPKAAVWGSDKQWCIGETASSGDMWNPVVLREAAGGEGLEGWCEVLGVI